MEGSLLRLPEIDGGKRVRDVRRHVATQRVGQERQVHAEAIQRRLAEIDENSIPERRNTNRICAQRQA
jgi:hypothetical protein